MNLKLLLTGLLALVAMAVSPPAWAGGATDVVKTSQRALFRLLAHNSPENNKAVTAVLETMMDFPALARASLGAEWRKRSVAEKTDFQPLMKLVISQAYTASLRQFLAYDVVYLDEIAIGDRVLVQGLAKRGESVEMNYKMAKISGKWKVEDIIIRKMSLTVSYGGQFGHIIEKEGFPALLQQMRARIAQSTP